jgi:hypothetical protein
MDDQAQWCESILAAVEGLHFGVDRNASMHLLGQAALSLNQIVQPEKSKADHLNALEATIKAIQARSAAQADAEVSPLKAGAI